MPAARRGTKSKPAPSRKSTSSSLSKTSSTSSMGSCASKTPGLSSMHAFSRASSVTALPQTISRSPSRASVCSTLSDAKPVRRSDCNGPSRSFVSNTAPSMHSAVSQSSNARTVLPPLSRSSSTASVCPEATSAAAIVIDGGSSRIHPVDAELYDSFRKIIIEGMRQAEELKRCVVEACESLGVWLSTKYAILSPRARTKTDLPSRDAAAPTRL